MTVDPLFEEKSGTGILLGHLAGGAAAARGPLAEATPPEGKARRLAIYPAAAGFDLVDELDHLATRTIEPNIFFNPRFLAPAMPRLEDRDVRLAVIRDGDGSGSRLRLLVPFSIERPVMRIGPPLLRTWANPYGPLGTPLVDRDDPVGVVGDFLSMMARPHLRLPRAFVLPEIHTDGPLAGVLRVVAAERNLPLVTVNPFERPLLRSDLDGDAYLREGLRAHHLRDYRRLERRLGETGELTWHVAETPDDVRIAAEEFLSLEAAGWKGRSGTAMAVDRFRAAFLREAVGGLAERAMCRIHSLQLDGRTIASLIVFVEAGVAYTWKTAFDETLSAFSPGVLLMLDVTRRHLEDPNIQVSDSCAVTDHPVMTRLWQERASLATFVIGLDPSADRTVHQAAAGLVRHARTRSMARRVRNRMRKLIRRR